MIAVHTRLGRLAHRFAKLVQQAKDGTLPILRPRQPKPEPMGAPSVLGDAPALDVAQPGTAPAVATSAEPLRMSSRSG